MNQYQMYIFQGDDMNPTGIMFTAESKEQAALQVKRATGIAEGLWMLVEV